MMRWHTGQILVSSYQCKDIFLPAESEPVSCDTKADAATKWSYRFFLNLYYTIYS